MRLMIGHRYNPQLLVEVSQFRTESDFDFRVVNGQWDGYFKDGKIHCKNVRAPLVESVSNYSILSDDQDKLCGEYNDVFNRFDL